jgi:hypothetical protein
VQLQVKVIGAVVTVLWFRVVDEVHDNSLVVDSVVVVGAFVLLRVLVLVVVNVWVEETLVVDVVALVVLVEVEELVVMVVVVELVEVVLVVLIVVAVLVVGLVVEVNVEDVVVVNTLFVDVAANEEQSIPSYGLLHKHIKLEPNRLQLPPFKHGFGTHGSSKIFFTIVLSVFQDVNIEDLFTYLYHITNQNILLDRHTQNQ